ncbi:hypothetical protein N7466_004916 [Penicillium verhagenii]|uniref:uncharacterized protein n=1 Tax=Penicillium verhagenii TaxID=1562060 RepID=UPI0025454E96|nr:uncharacterized protein N7466_004916 [Penicillium verhagenii]KAJ5935369.1 hypothetical protein N7466_004916 [Penicillium verhagenii]
MDLSLYQKSNLLYDQESVLRYRPGGYHPVTLGDVFKNDRYKIYHKLGWGGYSTVWLAKDRDQDQWVALKIMTADSEASRELQNMRHLERECPSNLSSVYIVQLLDAFTHEGPNGVHQCLVLELLGPSVNHVLRDYSDPCSPNDPLEPEIILRLSTQVIKAVRFIHSSGMCHGDVSDHNMAFTCTAILDATPEKLLEIIGSPEIEELARIDGKPLEKGQPTQLVKAAEWVDWIDEDEEEIRLIDFGEAFLQGDEPERLHQPGILQVPETILTDSFDYRLDLWRLGLVIYAFAFMAYPFMYLGDDEFLGICRLNGRRSGKSCRRNLEFDQEHNRLESRFARRVQDPELQPLMAVIKGFMRFLPSSRLTTEKALELLHVSSAEEGKH